MAKSWLRRVDVTAKLAFQALLVGLAMASLVGCGSTPVAPPVPLKGAVIVNLTLPLVFESTVSVNATLNRQTVSAGAVLREGAAQVVLTDLTPGAWEISAYVHDSDGHVVGTSSGSALVVANSTTTLNFYPALSRGALRIIVDIPSGPSVESGTARLFGLAGEVDRDEPLVIGAGTATATMSDVPGGTRTLGISLYSQNGVAVAYGSGRVTTRPGDTTEAAVSIAPYTGTLTINSSWNSPPQAPTGLAVRSYLTNVQLSWDRSSERDVVGYHVFRGTSPTGPKRLMTDRLLSDPYFADNTTEMGVTYWYSVAAYDSGRLASDFSAPASGLRNVKVETVGSADIPGSRFDIWGCYAAVLNRNGISIVDVLEPAFPTLKGSAFVSDSMGVAFRDNLAFVISSNGHLQIVDAADPSLPTLRGRLPFQYTVAVKVGPEYAYILDSTGLNVVDFRDPARPVVAGHLGLAYGQYTLELSGHLAFVGGPEQLSVIDLSDARAPRIIGIAATWVSKVTVAGSYAYASTGSTLKILDISDPQNPQVINTVDLLTNSSVSDLAVAGNVLFVSADGLRVFDLTDPVNPRFHGLVPDMGTPSLLQKGEYVYATTGSRFYVLKATRP